MLIGNHFSLTCEKQKAVQVLEINQNYLQILVQEQKNN